MAKIDTFIQQINTSAAECFTADGIPPAKQQLLGRGKMLYDPKQQKELLFTPEPEKPGSHTPFWPQPSRFDVQMCHRAENFIVTGSQLYGTVTQHIGEMEMVLIGLCVADAAPQMAEQLFGLLQNTPHLRITRAVLDTRAVLRNYLSFAADEKTPADTMLSACAIHYHILHVSGPEFMGQ